MNKVFVSIAFLQVNLANPYKLINKSMISHTTLLLLFEPTLIVTIFNIYLLILVWNELKPTLYVFNYLCFNLVS